MLFPTTIKLSPLATKLANLRLLSSSTVKLSDAKQSPLYKLRQKTGLTYNLCREALNKHNDDINEAESWLKAQALALGLQKATKVGGRSTREGLVSLATNSSHKIISVFEVNCETDFVSKNQVFRDFVLDLTEQFVSRQNGCFETIDENQKFIQKLEPSVELLAQLNDQIVPLISKLGENLKINRALHFKCGPEENTQLFGHVHALACQKNVNNLSIMAGRFGALVGLKKQKENSSPELLDGIGNRLCRHIIGYNPTYIELPDDIRRHMESIEKERKLELEKEAASNINKNNKNDDHGDLQEGPTSDSVGRDEWPSMMDQTLIMSEDGTTVRDYCNQTGIEIVYTNRFECGVE